MKNVRITYIVSIAAISSLFVACGARVKGTYSGGNFFDSLDFKSGNKVEIAFMSMTKEGSYAVEGNKVKVTVGGDTQVMTIDDKGCLDGGQLLGTYCKGASSGGSGGALAGTYRASDGNGGITLNFLKGRKVHLMIAERGSRPETADGTYQIQGDRVTIAVPGGMPMVLRRSGAALEGSFGGQGMKFVKQ